MADVDCAWRSGCRRRCALSAGFCLIFLCGRSVSSYKACRYPWDGPIERDMMDHTRRSGVVAGLRPLDSVLLLLYEHKKLVVGRRHDSVVGMALLMECKSSAHMSISDAL